MECSGCMGNCGVRQRNVTCCCCFFFKESVWYDRPIANGDIKREKEAQNYWTETKQVHKMCNKRNWSTVTPERKMSYEIIFFIDIKGIFFFKTVIIFKTASLVVSEDDEMLVMSVLNIFLMKDRKWQPVFHFSFKGKRISVNFCQ